MFSKNDDCNECDNCNYPSEAAAILENLFDDGIRNTPNDEAAPSRNSAFRD